MPINVNQQLNTNKPIEDDIFDNGKDGSTPSLASASIVASATEGQGQTTVAADGDLRWIDTDQALLDFDPTTHLNGNATQRLSLSFLFRALYRLIRVVANRIPVPTGGRIPVETGTVTANLGTIGDVATEQTLLSVVQALAETIAVDGSGTVQPVSANSLPLPTGAAENATLQEVRDRFRVSDYSVGSTSTSATGTQYVALESGVATAITIRNRTGTTLEIRKSGGTNTLLLANNEDLPLPVLANSNEWELRRSDISNTQASVKFLRYTA